MMNSIEHNEHSMNTVFIRIVRLALHSNLTVENLVELRFEREKTVFAGKDGDFAFFFLMGENDWNSI